MHAVLVNPCRKSRKDVAWFRILSRICSSSGWKGRPGISACHSRRSSSFGRAASRGIFCRQSQIGQVYLSHSLTLPRAIFRHLPWYLAKLAINHNYRRTHIERTIHHKSRTQSSFQLPSVCRYRIHPAWPSTAQPNNVVAHQDYCLLRLARLVGGSDLRDQSSKNFSFQHTPCVT